MSAESPALALIDAETGEILEPPHLAWREHTADRWKRDFPDQYAQCVEAIKAGEVNISRLSKMFGNPRTGKDRSRNTITGLIHAEFSVEQFKRITAMKAALASAQAFDQAGEVVEKATAKELGALAMLGKGGMEVSQVLSGGPSEIKESRNLTITPDAYRAWLAEEEARLSGTGSQAGKVSAFAGPPAAAAPLPDGSQGGKIPPSNDSQSVDFEEITIRLMLVFIPLSQLFT